MEKSHGTFMTHWVLLVGAKQGDRDEVGGWGELFQDKHGKRKLVSGCEELLPC